AANTCGSTSEVLVITFSSSIPSITSPLIAIGLEGTAFSYRIRATDTPTSFDAQSLPPGLTVNSITGFITGKPVYAGDFSTTVSASNVWGIGYATVHFTFTNAIIAGLSVAELTTNYSSPYLLDFQFSLRDDNDPTIGNGLVVDPRFLSVT